MNEIIPGLYLGNFKSGKDRATLQQLGITHVLTLNERPIPSSVSSNFEYLFVEIADDQDANILEYLPRTTEFIDSALSYETQPIPPPSSSSSSCPANDNLVAEELKDERNFSRTRGGAIYVHCMLGMSRSATAVVAYLMRRNGWCLAEALASVKARRPIVRPNLAFIKQLKLWQAMGCRLDPANNAYKQHCLYYKAQRLHSQPRPTQPEHHRDDSREKPEQRLGVDRFILNFAEMSSRSSGGTSSSSSLDVCCQAAAQLVCHECRNCMTTLFTSENLVDHYLPVESAFWSHIARQKTRRKCNLDDLIGRATDEFGEVCARGEIFIEPMSWMRKQMMLSEPPPLEQQCNEGVERVEAAIIDSSGEAVKLQGVLSCPQCASEIGSFNWFGQKCVCGKWAVPAFHIDKTRTQNSQNLLDLQRPSTEKPLDEIPQT